MNVFIHFKTMNVKALQYIQLGICAKLYFWLRSIARLKPKKINKNHQNLAKLKSDTVEERHTNFMLCKLPAAESYLFPERRLFFIDF